MRWGRKFVSFGSRAQRMNGGARHVQKASGDGTRHSSPVRILRRQPTKKRSQMESPANAGRRRSVLKIALSRIGVTRDGPTDPAAGSATIASVSPRNLWQSLSEPGRLHPAAPPNEPPRVNNFVRCRPSEQTIETWRLNNAPSMPHYTLLSRHGIYIKEGNKTTSWQVSHRLGRC